MRGRGLLSADRFRDTWVSMDPLRSGDGEDDMSHYDKYRKTACEWCASEKPFYPPWKDMTGKFKNHHVKEQTDTTTTMIACDALPIEQWAEQIAANLEQVDDVLIVNWITVKDNDYRKALADLVTMNIAQHNDPILMPKITGVAMRHRDTKEVVSLPSPARHHILIRKLVDDGRPDFPKNCEHGFILENGDYIGNYEARIYAMQTKQIGTLVLTSEDLW